MATATNKVTIKDSEEAAKTSAARLSMLAAAFLIILKTATGFITGSISVWASLLDSTMDIFASTINYFAVRAAPVQPTKITLTVTAKPNRSPGFFNQSSLRPPVFF